MCIFVGLCECECSADGGQKRALFPLELVLQGVNSELLLSIKWVQETELTSSARIVSILTCWAIFPALIYNIFYI